MIFSDPQYCTHDTKDEERPATIISTTTTTPTLHNDLTTNKNYFDFLSPVASFGPK